MELNALLKKASAGKKPVVISVDGKNIGAIISMEELKLLRKIRRVEEDRADLRIARKAKKEKGGVTLARFKKQLGLD
ncbi:MAG: type II toxin-antitoxin system prevent-host-death family antitoxin [Nitrospinae bacterium]|nr:type II toxin-antitoxin system prevent-host-death family antitoxin [Nitrospinota bacterium]